MSKIYREFGLVGWGGYIQGWQWTGFPANAQLWDWLHLLLLPVVVGTIPLWIKQGCDISRVKRITYGAVVLAIAAFVAAGYLIPLKWTGFPGTPLWSWYGLILLPAAVATLGAWPMAGRSLRPHHKAAIVFLVLGWAVTVVGGYALHWVWTGYQGNTLWDWLQLLLLPLLVPTILLPAVVKWVSGNAPRRVQRNRKVPERVQRTQQTREPVRRAAEPVRRVPAPSRAAATGR